MADSIQNNIDIDSQLDALKKIIYSHEWKPVDADNYRRMVELINFVERTPIDTVVVNLRIDIESMPELFYREINDIPEAEQVNGYIKSVTLNKELDKIEKKLIEEIPLESIIVPEEEFVGMYSKLPLITHGNMEQLVTDSLVTIPDSLIINAAGIYHGRSDSRKAEAEEVAKTESDSLIAIFLNEARKQYNDSIIKAYRDSVMTQYRINYRQERIENAKRIYKDDIERKNHMVLEAYNDSLTEQINKDFKALLELMVNYVHRMPNTLTVYNLFNEESVLPLQNEGIWFKWVQLKNMQNDSIGVRIENLGRNSMRILVDETVNLSRLTQRSSINIDMLKSDTPPSKELSKVSVKEPKIFPWTFVGRMYSGLTQTFINEFWSKGGVTSASTMTTFNYEANYSKGKAKWENGIDAKLGFIQYIDIDDENPPPRNWHKNTDNFELNSRFGYSAVNNWYYSAEANFKTQFALGYKNNLAESPNSGFMSPANLTFSAGLDYKPNKHFSVFLSPVSLRTTYVLNPDIDATRFGLSEGETQRSRIGMTSRVNYSKDILPNVSIHTRNNIFINFGSKDDEWQMFKLPDFDSETTLDFKITRYISTQLNMHFIYDKELTSKWEVDGVELTGTRLQIKEFLTFGLSYKF
jgi:hypothetical protein